MNGDGITRTDIQLSAARLSLDVFTFQPVGSWSEAYVTVPPSVRSSVASVLGVDSSGSSAVVPSSSSPPHAAKMRTKAVRRARSLKLLRWRIT
jgi:hypothetical protein